MAKKMMEIIDHKMDLKNGSVSLKLLDTSFSQLTRKIGSNPGTNWKKATEGYVLSKEVLTSLNTDQLAFKTRFNNFINAYAAWVASVAAKIALERFSFNYSSLVDYSSKYVPEQTLADYSLLGEFINAEKELYESSHFWAEENFKRNQNLLKNYSKSKPYTTSISQYRSSQYEVTSSSKTKWVVVRSSNKNVSVTKERETGDKNRFIIGNLQNIAINEIVTFNMTALQYNGSGEADATFKIKRQQLYSGDTEGYIVFIGDEFKDRGAVKIVGSIDITYGVNRWSGNHSPHFDGTPSLVWFKRRNLI